MWSLACRLEALLRTLRVPCHKGSRIAWRIEGSGAVTRDWFQLIWKFTERGDRLRKNHNDYQRIALQEESHLTCTWWTEWRCTSVKDHLISICHSRHRRRTRQDDWLLLYKLAASTQRATRRTLGTRWIDWIRKCKIRRNRVDRKTPPPQRTSRHATRLTCLHWGSTPGCV